MVSKIKTNSDFLRLSIAIGFFYFITFIFSLKMTLNYSHFLSLKKIISEMAIPIMPTRVKS